MAKMTKEQFCEELYQGMCELMSDIQWRLDPEGDNEDDYLFEEESWKRCEKITNEYNAVKK